MFYFKINLGKNAWPCSTKLTHVRMDVMSTPTLYTGKIAACEFHVKRVSREFHMNFT